MAGEEEAWRPLRLWHWNAQPAHSLGDVPRWVGWLGFAAGLTIAGGPAFCYLAYQLGQRDGVALEPTEEPHSRFGWRLVPWALPGLATDRRLLAILATTGILLAVIGSLLPWAKLTDPSVGEVIVSGTENAGIVTLVLALAAAGLLAWLYWGKGHGVGRMTLLFASGLTISAIAIYDIVDLNNLAGALRATALVELRPGIFITLTGGIAISAAGLLGILSRQQVASEPEPDDPAEFLFLLSPLALLAAVLYLMPMLGFGGVPMPLLVLSVAAPLAACLVVAHVANVCYKQGLSVGARTRTAPRALVSPSVRAWALTGVFFLATLLVYYLSRGLDAVANNPMRLAEALLDGRLDIANGAELGYLDFAFYEGKYYVLEPPAMALVVLPGVILFGLALNQSLVSIVIGGLAVAAVYRLMAGLTEKVSVQFWLTALFGFGTIFWWTTTQGGIWYFAHSVSVLFLVVAIYETLIGKRPFSAGFFLGASYLARLPVILAFPFFLIMFSDQWLREPSGARSLRESLRLGPTAVFTSLKERIDLKPLMLLATGVGIPLVFSFVYNYLRFEDPLNSGYAVWADFQGPKDILQADRLCISRTPAGLCMFDVEYAARSIPVFFQAVPVFTIGQGDAVASAPYVYPSWSGIAFWATTPAFLYALFAGIRSKPVIVGGAIAIFLSILILIFAARGLGWSGFAYDASFHYRLRFSDLTDFLYDVTIYPFLLLIAYVLLTGIPNKLVRRGWFTVGAVLLFFAIIGPPPLTYALLLWFGAGAVVSIVNTLAKGTGNKLVLACWAAIIPIAFVHFIYPITGWPMVGYRYALDYYPFVLLLVWVGMRDQIKWHQALLITASIVVSAFGVLWINVFDSREVFFEPGNGIRWVNW
jgi:hypothetical protein